MAISLRLSDSEASLVKSYAQMNGISVSELVRRCVLERIEDEYDLQAFHAAQAQFAKDPTTYSLDEVEKELGLA